MQLRALVVVGLVSGCGSRAASPDLGEPTHGAILDDQLWFLANSGWSRFSDDGALVNDPPEDAPSIWRVPTAPR
jgi:hypothetical protein